MNLSAQIKKIEITSSEAKIINDIIVSIINEKNTSVDDIVGNIKLHSDGLPLRLRKEIYSFKMIENSFCLDILHPNISSFDFGLTPSKISRSKDQLSIIEIYHLLLSSYLGEIFTWDSIQNGNIINEVFPIKDDADKLISSGTNNLFDLHTEDAFHPFKGEYLSLLCLRNPAFTSTVLSFLSPDDLPLKIKDELFKPIFYIGKNIAHSIDKETEVQYFPLLFGSDNDPYINVNLNNMRVRNNDSAGISALNFFIDILRKNTVSYPLKTGSLLLIDNFRVVHGREVYSARYDGYDRWLKRIYLTNDLRRSRSIRNHVNSRLLQVK